MDIKQPVTGDIYRPSVKVLKVKNDIPTVFEIHGRRYVLDHTNHKG